MRAFQFLQSLQMRNDYLITETIWPKCDVFFNNVTSVMKYVIKLFSVIWLFYCWAWYETHRMHAYQFVLHIIFNPYHVNIFTYLISSYIYVLSLNPQCCYKSSVGKPSIPMHVFYLKNNAFGFCHKLRDKQ